MLCDEVCCSVLQCVAVCCSVLQCIAVCCSAFHCVAVFCTGNVLPTYKQSFAFTNDANTNPFTLVKCMIRGYNSYISVVYMIVIYDLHCPHTNDHSHIQKIKAPTHSSWSHASFVLQIWFVYISRIYDSYIWPALPTYKRSFAYTNNQSTNPFILVICLIRMYASYISLIYMTCIAHVQTVIRIYEWSKHQPIHLCDMQ